MRAVSDGVVGGSSGDTDVIEATLQGVTRDGIGSLGARRSISGARREARRSISELRIGSRACCRNQRTVRYARARSTLIFAVQSTVNTMDVAQRFRVAGHTSVVIATINSVTSNIIRGTTKKFGGDSNA